MTLDEAVAEFERHFDVHEFVSSGTPGVSMTGEPYREVVSGGEKDEGSPVCAWCGTEAVAVKLWLQAAFEYASSVHLPSKGNLYWRIRPEMGKRHWKSELDGAPGFDVFCVYSRFLITSKPEIEQKDAA